MHGRSGRAGQTLEARPIAARAADGYLQTNVATGQPRRGLDEDVHALAGHQSAERQHQGTVAQPETRSHRGALGFAQRLEPTGVDAAGNDDHIECVAGGAPGLGGRVTPEGDGALCAT